MIHRISIINGNPVSGSHFTNESVESTTRQLTIDGFHVTSHTLSRKNIRQCVGCWDCWWKTPGICRFKDDVADILKDIINSDLVIYCSPMIMGMYSALLKKLNDRTIPLLHPYLELIQGECHHRKRYACYPQMGVLLDKRDAAGDEIENTRFIFKRIALNFHSEVKFFHVLQEMAVKNLSNEISSF